MMPVKPETLPISVVIASVGRRELEETIKSLRSASAVPEQIMICIPEHVQPEAQLQEDECLEVVWTPCRGQVAQRAYGLARIRNAYALQMDDDVLLPETALQELFAAIVETGKGHVVAPLFKHCNSGEYLTKYRKTVKGFLQSLSASVIGMAPWGTKRMGRIDRSGIPYAVDSDYCDGEKLFETEWVPGGCAICHKDDLILDNYFTFHGKAYSEDVIHSLLWRKQGIRLWVSPDITVCFTHVAAMPSSMASMRADYRARAHVVALSNGSLLRCRLWFAMFVVRQWLAGLLRRSS